ncbi:MAG TPA: GNAT family N-acetyltransferase [Myxococcaceae bacterium]|nr:GNAT family N-acetyltransferase [Myxococcaceae bacterium]
MASLPESVVELNERASFVALEEEWNALVELVQPQPFFRHEFFRVWLDNFAPSQRWRILVHRDERGKLQGVLPLIADAGFMLGVPVRRLLGAANVHSCRFDLVASDPARSAQLFLGHLAADRGWDVLLLSDVPEGGGGFEILSAARRARCPVGTWESMRSPYMPLGGSTPADEELSAKFRANLRRRRRNLEASGQVTLERVQGGPALERALEDGFWLERQGWKGAAGTAIAFDAKTRGFYSELAKAAALHGYLSCYFLRLDGEPVAFHYALELGRRYFLFKPAYSERLKEMGLGHLLVNEVLRDCIERGVEEFDFLGPDLPWKREWTRQTRPHTWLFVFRDSTFGRALCRARFRWAPAAGRLIRRWKR